MVCTLTAKQQRLLFGKVAIDLKNMESFDFRAYGKQMYDLVNNKTGDPVLAVNYVAMLPMNIRAVMGVSKDIFGKLAKDAQLINELETQFEDFANVEDFVNSFATQQSEMVQLQNTLQQSSLTKPKQQEPKETEAVEFEPLTLSDTPMDFTKDGFLKPDMKVYADAKDQLIANRKEDGSSMIGDTPVVLQIMSTQGFETGDFYPDVQTAIMGGDPKVVKASKEGVVLVVTDRAGQPLKFNPDLTRNESGQGTMIYFNLRKPAADGKLNLADENLINNLVKTGMTKVDAEAVVKKRNEVISKIRTYVSANPSSNKVPVNILGGIVNYSRREAKNKVTISALDFGTKPFAPYKGIPEKGQYPNVYYFDFNGVTMTVDSPSVPEEMVNKLVQLLTEDVKLKKGSKSYDYGVAERIKLYKQFVFNEPDVFDLFVTPEGRLGIKKLGITQQYKSTEEMAQDIRDMLTRKVPVKKISAEKAKGKTRAVNLKTAMYNQVWEQVSPEGNVSYYTIGQVQLKVNDTAYKNNLFYDFNIQNGIINVEKKSYYPFIANNFLLTTNYSVDASGKFQTAGSYLNFQVDPGATFKIAKQQRALQSQPVQQSKVKSDEPPLFDERGNFNERGKTEPPKPAAKLSAKEKLLKLRKEDPKKFNKIVGQKGLEATLEQIVAAEKWYNSHPMSVYFPFETMFDVVNQESSNSIATWTMNGVTLYKGADFSDLYHEAWHGFTQGFMTPEQKDSLYNEARKKSGTFVTYNGTTVSFAKATDLQIEEYFAEDFREYMLTGKVMKDAPVRNSFFRKILNFLKALFGQANNNQVIADKQVTQTVRDLYEKLRVGDLTDYTFAAENRNFDTLNKALTAIDENEEQKSLSFENSNLIFNTINSLFSEGIDVLNQANIEDINELRTLQSKMEKSIEDRARLKELTAQNLSSYTTVMLSTTKGLKELYEYAKLSLEEKLADFIERNDIEPSPALAKKIELLQYALRNFGDTENIYKNRKDEGVIGYHLYKSDLIDDDVYDEIDSKQKADAFQVDYDELVEREQEGKQSFDRGGNERSIFDLAAREMRTLIGSLNKTDIEGNIIENQLEFPEIVSFREAFAYIARTVQNAKDLVEMYDLLQREALIYPPIKQLLSKMGPLSYEGQTEKEVDMWSKFYQTMNKYRIPLVQTTVNEARTETESSFDIRIGNALAEYKRIDQDWRSDFAKAVGHEFIRNDINGNYLDVKALFEKYPSMSEVNADPMGFLRDIGVKLKNIGIIKSKLEEEISAGRIRLSGIYDNLQKLDELGVVVRGMGAYLTHNKKNGIIGQTGPNSNYGKILQLQSKYSGDYSDFMVQNAAGDPQSEFSQNNSLTQIVKQVNSAPSYNDLVNNPTTAHYNKDQTPGRPYNPFVNASIWIRSLFNMEESGGPRYDDNEMVVENLSGVNSSVNDALFEEGVVSSQADEITKLLSDFHIQLMKFTPELTRHAGKKTSLAVSLRNYKTGSRNARLYIDTENFITEQGEFNQGFDDFYQIIVKYVGAELERVKYARYLLTPEAGVQEYDFNYLKRASKFVAFSGVFSEATKNALYEVDNLEEYLASPEGVALSEAMYDEVMEYFNGLTNGVADKMRQHFFVSPALVEKTREDAKKIGKDDVTDSQIHDALIGSFVANNWIHHFEEMIMLYGDIAQFKDFFKRNASLNSTGDIVRNDPYFVNHVNEKLGKPFAKAAGVAPEVTAYNGILNTSISDDVVTASVYLEEYKKTVDSPTIDAKYGKGGVNEADAQGLITLDTYRIILDGLGKWTPSQENAFQQILSGRPLDRVDATNIFPVLKMGYYGPLQTEYLPLTALHKFALMPLIPGLSSNLDALHNKMMQEGIDYHTFASGSKVSTVTGPEGLQPFYSDLTKRELNQTPFVKNRVFVEFLKYQVEAKPKFKGKMTLPTQLRKLAEIGLMENGVPTDYTGTKTAWKKLSETQKKLASKNYTLRQNYIKSLRELVEYKKNELLSDIGWRRDKNGKLIGDMESLLKLISGELKRADVGDHEWAYIQTIKGNDIKNSLDISQSADMIEKVITALVNKRLINIKVKGEQLVMVATTGFEDMAFAYGEERNFEKPTAEDLQKYGTNDLPTYHIRDGKIAAAKVKIAIQGDFKKLLELDDVQAKAEELGIRPFQALNLLLKNEDWLNEGDNRAMISMVGARIPTQGPNSVDFVEVYEFLPEIAGNIIIAPSEVTSKGGSDFDYDKLPLMMPNIAMMNGKPALARKYNEDEARQAYNFLLKQNVHKMTFQGLDRLEVRALLQTSDRFEKIDTIVAKLLGPDYYEQIAEVVREDTMDSFETFYEKLNGTGAIENAIQRNLRQIFERPENLPDLIRPNDTDITKPLADQIKSVQDKGKSAGYDKEGTRMYEVLHNLKVQQSNSIGKDTLGIGAISNTFNAVFNSVGLTLKPTYGKLKKRATLLLNHNLEEKAVSLSNRFDGLNENNVADVISQLINGWVDVEKDDWISYIQGNKEIAPVLLFMVQAGVPIKEAVLFVSQPLVRKYVEEQRLMKSNFAGVFGYGESKKAPKRAAKMNVLTDPVHHFDLPDTKAKTIYQATLNATSEIEQFDPAFMEVVMNDSFEQVENRPVTDFDRAVFLHFLEIEDMAKEVDKVSRAFNVDTTPLQTLTEFYGKIAEIEDLGTENSLVPKEFIDEIKNNSPIGPFYIQEFALELFGRVMPLRNSQVLNDYLNGLTSDDIGVYDLDSQESKMKFYQIFKNDLLNYLFQRELRSFDPKMYRNGSVAFDVTDARGFQLGAFVRDGKLYVNEPQLREDYKTNGFSKDSYGNSQLAPVAEDAFVNFEEYQHFVYERETLRSMYPFNSVNGSVEFAEYMRTNEVRDELRKEDESTEDFVKRLEKISYEQYLRDKALYNIFNPYQLFKGPNNVASTYQFILEKYPYLKENFSLLKNIKVTAKDEFVNLMPSTIKWNKDEIDTFHENFKDLANSNKLLEIDGISQRDADYIADFFGRLPMYLYMQAGPTNRNPFSFGRMLPQEKILSVLDKPVKELTENINNEFLDEFRNRFIVANSDKATRNRFKEFLKSDKEAVEVKLRPLFTESRLLEKMSFRGKPIQIKKIVSKRGTPVAATNYPTHIEIDLELLKVKFEEKAWATPAVENVEAIPADEFATFDEFLTFVLLHERYHDSIIQEEGEDKGVYENRVNEAALTDLRTFYEKPMQLNLFRETKPVSTGQIDFQEESTTGYRNRTIKNASADATIAIAVDFNSAGEKLTKSSVLNQNKAYIPIAFSDETVTTVEEYADKIVDKLNSVNARSLNIAGNGIYTMKGTYSQEQVDDFTYELLKNVIESPKLKNKITSLRTGGQTGFDEAGAKAGLKLGIPTMILAPKGWTFRNEAGKDISDEQQFKDRFKSVEIAVTSSETISTDAPIQISDTEVENEINKCFR